MTSTLSEEKRWCFYIPQGQCNENGYIPSVVTEDEPGHAPLVGRGSMSQPWYWGHEYEQACKIARECNLERGLSDDDVDEIVISSVAASCRQDGRVAAARERLEGRGEPRNAMERLLHDMMETS